MTVNVLITGSAGFIGYHLSYLLLENGLCVIGVDNLNDYYDVQLKIDRQTRLVTFGKYKHYTEDFSDPSVFKKIFSENDIDMVVHLGAQAGVRNSIINPEPYIQTNIYGSYLLLEECRRHNIEHLLMASTSSAYGTTATLPFKEDEISESHVSLYAATKKSMETMAHSYAHVHGVPTTIFRFFTVYGPWGRPDMALFKFTKNIIENKPIDVYNYGRMKRDFTYVEDLATCIYRLLAKIPEAKDLGASLVAPYRLVNIGNSKPVELLRYIEELENCLGLTAKKNLMEMQVGDIIETEADTRLLKTLIGYSPNTEIGIGIQRFTDWYQEYYVR